MTEQVKGQYAISIATSLALEGILGEHPDRPAHRPLLPNYKEMWLNLRTIIRNTYESIPSDQRQLTEVDVLVDMVKSDVDAMFGLISEKSKQTIPRLYFVDNPEKAIRGAAFKEPKTEKQKVDALAHQQVLEGYLTRYDLDEYAPVTHFASGLALVKERDVVILTHWPFDLLFYKKFKVLDLLESHTGVVKRRAQYHTKLHNCRYEQMPFNAFTLQVYGDGVFFESASVKARQTLTNIASTKKWNNNTTQAKIRSDLNHIEDPKVRSELMVIAGRSLTDIGTFVMA